jgi:hypothetical protein
LKTTLAFLKYIRAIAERLGGFAHRLAALSNRDCSAANCAILAVALTLGSVQPLLGVIVYQDSRPAFTLDICHPLESLDQSPSVVPLASPAARGRLVAIDFERVCEFVSRPLTEFIPDIDPPPPKPAA